MTTLLALALLFTSHPADKLHFLASEMQFVCIAVEVMDSRERKQMFVKPEEFAGDLSTMRTRLKSLYDAPRLHECYLWPERAISGEMILMNRDIKRRIEAIYELYPESRSLKLVLEDLEARYQLWDAARDARTEFYYIHIRREAMKKLLNLLGEEAFSRGELPFGVPTWRVE
jgi:hypothetical protein